MDVIFTSMVFDNGVRDIKQGILVSKYFITKMHKEPIERQLLDSVKALFLLDMPTEKEVYYSG
jgi:hypothetical protein